MTLTECIWAANGQLRHWLTNDGVMKWWSRPHPMLDGQTPLWAAALGNYQQVIDLAESGRSMELS